MSMRAWLLALLGTLLLGGCGGGEPDRPEVVSPAAQRLRDALAGLGTTRWRAAAAIEGTDAQDAADQLLNFAERQFPQYFPGPRDSADWDGYRFRHYPTTGSYLGVRGGEVFVTGGTFGAGILRVGPLTQFITPVPGASRLPCAQAGRTHGVFVTPVAAVGRNASAALLGCAGPIADPLWRQTEGPSVALAADRTQAISFDPPQAGRYAFELRFTTADGQRRHETVHIDVAAAAPASGLTLRASQAVRAGGPVSVRAWPVDDGVGEPAISWVQVAGPAVSIDTTDARLATFVAPRVERDTLIRLRATARASSGVESADEALIVVEPYQQAADDDPQAVWSGEHVTRVHAFRADSPWAASLAECAYNARTIAVGERANLCRLGRLPYLGQEMRGAEPSVDDIMNRVLVSHDWQGRNFERFLRTQDPHGDFRKMLVSVTAVVIGSSIRPSQYRPITGAIYLDADSFWLTPEERDTVNERPDPRSEFDDGLQYGTLWRYVYGARNATAYDDPERRITRDVEALRAEVSALLYHELTHAIDYMPSTGFAQLTPEQTVLDAFWPRYAGYEMASDRLQSRHPLSSVQMWSLAQVKYRGATPTPAQRSYDAEQVARLFHPDVATDEYAFTTPLEDLAMLTEEFMMRHRLGMVRDIAFTDRITADSTSSTLIVRWGQRGRAGDSYIRPRVRLAIELVLPWIPPTAADLAPAPTQLSAGQSWSGTLNGGSTGAAQRARPDDRAAWRERQALQRWLQRQRERHAPPIPRR